MLYFAKTPTLVKVAHTERDVSKVQLTSQNQNLHFLSPQGKWFWMENYKDL